MKVLLLALVAFAACHTGSNWAVLVAGSDGYGNYRHQADIFHAYQILKRNGVPKEHIIVFAKDDIAQNSRNPFKGKVFNRPNGPDVYAGVVIDYKGNDVTAANYLKVIQGDKAGMKGIGSGKVLESTAKDNVFMFYSDHGSSGLVAFPVGGYLYADKLQAALVNMNKKKMYNKFVYYLEACYSGSMFMKMPKNLNIYATTAANERESSYGYYCGGEAKVNGTSIGSCLGDEYSIKWMEDTDKHLSPTGYTIGQQFETVKKQTAKSHVMEYGTLAIKTDQISEYQFGVNDRCSLRQQDEPIEEYEGIRVNSRQAFLQYLKQQAEMTDSEEDMSAYLDEVKLTARSKLIFERYAAKFNVPEQLVNDIDFDCLRSHVRIYTHLCGINDRDLEFMHTFSNACSLEVPPSPLRVYSALKAICSKL